jgi:hypothetical protein
VSTITKISALLAMAERTTNQHEAEAFLAKAQQLATLASVDIAMARAATEKREARQQPITKTIQIGELRARANRHLISLFIGLAHANDCQVDIAHNSTYVIAYGMPSDIEVTEVLFNSLATQMVAMGTSWVRKGEWKGDTYQSYVINRLGYRTPTKKQHTAMTARGAFYAGFTSSISDRVQRAREEAVAERTAAESAAESGALLSTAVVLRDKQKEIKNFHHRESQARGTWGGYSGAGSSGRGGAATRAGRAAGERAHIGRQGSIGGPPGQVTS